MWNFITLMEKTPALNDELWLFNFFIYAEKCFWRQQANKMKTATRHIWATDLSKPQKMTVAKNWIFDIFRKTVYFLNKMMSAFLSWLIFARRTGFYRMFFVEPSEQLQQTVCCSLIQEDRKWEYESVCDLVSLSTDSVCGAGTRVCASPRLVRDTGRKLQVQGKEKDGADGRPAHRSLVVRNSSVRHQLHEWPTAHTRALRLTQQMRAYVTWLSSSVHEGLDRGATTSVLSPPPAPAKITDRTTERQRNLKLCEHQKGLL